MKECSCNVACFEAVTVTVVAFTFHPKISQSELSPAQTNPTKRPPQVSKPRPSRHRDRNHSLVVYLGDWWDYILS